MQKNLVNLFKGMMWLTDDWLTHGEPGKSWYQLVDKAMRASYTDVNELAEDLNRSPGFVYALLRGDVDPKNLKQAQLWRQRSVGLAKGLQ